MQSITVLACTWQWGQVAQQAGVLEDSSRKVARQTCTFKYFIDSESEGTTQHQQDTNQENVKRRCLREYEDMQVLCTSASRKKEWGKCRKIWQWQGQGLGNFIKILDPWWTKDIHFGVRPGSKSMLHHVAVVSPWVTLNHLSEPYFPQLWKWSEILLREIGASGREIFRVVPQLYWEMTQ